MVDTETLTRIKDALLHEARERNTTSLRVEDVGRREPDPKLASIRSSIEDASRRIYKSRNVIALDLTKENHFHAGDVLELRLVPLDDLAAAPTTVNFRLTDTSELVALPLGLASILAFLLLTTL